MKHAPRVLLILTFAVTSQMSANTEENIESLKQNLPEVAKSLKEFVMPKEAADEMGFDWLVLTESQPKFKDGVAILDQKSMMRYLTGKKDRAGIVGVFTDPQFQLVAKIASKNADVTLKELPAAQLKWGECALVKSGDNIYGIAATAFEETISLELAFPNSGTSNLAENQAPESISIGDRFNVVWSETLDNGQIRWVVIRAAISPKAEEDEALKP